MRKVILLPLVLVVCALVAGAIWEGHTRSSATASAEHKGQAPAPTEIPVLAASAETKDVPLILRGLGTVQAYNTVPIKSRIEGAITKINFKDGQQVHSGDVLVELDARPYQAVLDQAKAVLAKNQAALSNAKVDLERYAKLLTQSFAPEQQYATQKSTVAQDEATVKDNEAAIEAAQLNVEYASIKSPINGVTGIRQIDLGNLVQANSQTLVVVTEIKPIYVIFTLPEADIGRIRDAMANGKLSVLAFEANDTKQVAAGTLNLVDNAVDQTTGTFKLKAEFANNDSSLWPGEFVNAHLVLRVVRDGVVVPSGAIQTGPKGAFTYVVKQDSTVEMRPVKVLQTENNEALVGSGLKAGEKVVTAGQFKLQQGTKVRVVDQIAGSAPPGVSDTTPGVGGSP